MFLLGTYSFKWACIPFLYKRKSSPWSYLIVWECELVLKGSHLLVTEFLTIISLMSKHQQQKSYPTLHQLILSLSKEIRLHHFQKEIARGLGINLWYSISLSTMIFSEDLGSETSRCTTEVSVGGSNVVWYTSVEQREMIIVWNNSAFR